MTASLLRPRPHVGEVLGHQIGPRLPQRAFKAAVEHRVLQRMRLDGDRPFDGREEVTPRTENGIELAVDQHDGALALRHGDPGAEQKLADFDHRHSPSSVASAHRMRRIFLCRRWAWGLRLRLNCEHLPERPWTGTLRALAPARRASGTEPDSQGCVRARSRGALRRHSAAQAGCGRRCTTSTSACADVSTVCASHSGRLSSKTG